jgi:hypothetical protein
MIGVNPIAAENDAIVTLHLDDEECGSERLAPYCELHGDDTPCLHRVGPQAIKHQVGLHGSAAIDEHPRDQLPIDVTLNIQWLPVLARFFGLLEHDLFRAKTHLSDLLLDTLELSLQREHHIDVHPSQWWRPSLINGASSSSSRSRVQGCWSSLSSSTLASSGLPVRCY